MRPLFFGLLLGMLGPILFDRLRYRPTPAAAEDPARAAAAAEAERSTEGARGTERTTPLDDLSQLARPELYRRAQAAGIGGRADMTKAQLIAALQGVNG
jgi:hypothetical protein